MKLESENRRIRADGIIAGLSPNERQRFGEAVGNLRIHWAALYGDRLSPLVTENMATESILNMAVLEAVHGQPPLTDQAWRSVARDISEADEWAVRNLAFSDAQVKAEIREKTLAELPGARRMAMQRSGELESFVENAVHEELSVRSGQSYNHKC